MSNEIKEKEEYEKYARDHRKELDAQEVKIGDVVKVLVGQFAGETGIVIGIIACDKSDYTDPYYEIALNCEVPEKYKCRKTLMTPNNVIGGLSAHEFEVIGNRAPKQPSMEIKQGDRVRVSKDAPKMYISGHCRFFYGVESVVEEIEDGNAIIRRDDGSVNKALAIPCKYLVKVDAEAKEAKFKVGDKVVRKNVSTVRTIISIDYVDDDEAPAYYYNTVDSQGNNPMDFLESELILYTESTPKYKKGDRVKICSKNAGRFGCVGTILEVHDNGTVVVDFNDYYVGGHLYSVDFIEPYTEPTAPTIKAGDRVRNIESGLIGVVDKIVYGNIAWVNGVDGKRYHWKSDGLELIEPTEQTEAEKPNHTIKIPVEVDLSDGYWDAYAADLAKEVALKVANKYNDPKQAADYAVSVAKAVVEGLKRKWV